MTEYKIFLIKSFLTTYNYLLLIYSSIRSLIICKYIDSNDFGEPFPHLKCENGSECGIGMGHPEKSPKIFNRQMDRIIVLIKKTVIY